MLACRQKDMQAEDTQAEDMQAEDTATPLNASMLSPEKNDGERPVNVKLEHLTDILPAHQPFSILTPSASVCLYRAFLSLFYTQALEEVPLPRLQKCFRARMTGLRHKMGDPIRNRGGLPWDFAGTGSKMTNILLSVL